MDCLLYVDPSPRGEWALAVAGLLPADFAPAMTLLATEEDVGREPRHLSSARARLVAPDRAIREETRPGPAEEAIAREASSRPYGVAIVPPAGRNAIQRMLRGSRIASVVKSVGTSVLVAKRPPIRIDRVLVAVSGALTPAVVAKGLEWSRALGAQPRFLHVVSDVALPFKPHGKARAAPERLPPADFVATIRGLLRQKGVGEPLVVREGLVVEEVLGEVEDGAHHLLVIGAQADTRSPRWARDDLTERVLLNCPTSILVVYGGA